MGLLIMAGRFANLLTRGVVTSSDADADFPLVDAYDGDPGTSFQHVSTISGLVVVDGDLSLGSGGFNDVHVGGAPPGWTDISSGGGTLFRDIGFVTEGASSLRLAASSGAHIPATRRDFYARAGEELTIQFDFSGNSPATIDVYLFDLETGKYLTSAGTWQTSTVALASKNSLGYQAFALTFRVSSLLDWPEAVRRLRFEAYGTGGANTWIDNWRMYPSWDTLGVFGHNVRPGCSLLLQSADTVAGPWTTEHTMVKKLPSCYGRTAAPVAKRCARVNMSGNNVEAPWYGELVLGQSVELPCAMTPVQTTYTDYRTMIPRPLGGVAARGRSAWPHRTKSLVFQHPDTPTTAESGYWAAWEAEFIIRSLGGAPMLLVPSTDRSEVLYGHCQPSISESDGSPGQAGYRRVDAVQIVDQALPVQL